LQQCRIVKGIPDKSRMNVTTSYFHISNNMYFWVGGTYNVFKQVLFGFKKIWRSTTQCSIVYSYAFAFYIFSNASVRLSASLSVLTTIAAACDELLRR
jgi:hypothetical protein